jgi:hypothetical protein
MGVYQEIFRKFVNLTVQPDLESYANFNRNLKMALMLVFQSLTLFKTTKFFNFRGQNIPRTYNFMPKFFSKLATFLYIGVILCGESIHPPPSLNQKSFFTSGMRAIDSSHKITPIYKKLFNLTKN